MSEQFQWSRESVSPSWRFWAALTLMIFILLSLARTVGAEDPCTTCDHLVKSVFHGLEKTARSHFGGGDAAWESERLGKYASSETRFVEAQEHMCKKKDVKDDILKDMSEDKCVHMMNEVEEDIEHWYFHKQKSDPNLHQWLCIDKLKHCCPVNKFGPNCDDCLGPEPSRPCFGNGNCEGAGSRKGTGKCICNAGYQGKTCRLCATAYFSVIKNDTHSVCEACHTACKTSCTGRDSKDCGDCKSGWTFSESKGCEDIDECAIENTCSKPNEICVNTPGSFSCNCKAGYTLKDNQCLVDVVEKDSDGSTETGNSSLSDGEHLETNNGDHQTPKNEAEVDAVQPDSSNLPQEEL